MFVFQIIEGETVKSKMREGKVDLGHDGKSNTITIKQSGLNSTQHRSGEG